VPLIGMTEPGGPYAVGATGQNKAIAVLDSGVQTNHPFITQAKVIAEACFSTASEARTRTVCPNGLNTQTGTGAGINCPSTLGGCDHGTHVAGIAVGNNTNINAGGPPNGVAKDAKLVAVQVFSQWNFQSDCNTMPAPCARYWQSDSGAALDWVYANMASLPGGVALVSVNMSLVEQLTSSNCDTDFRKPVIDNLRAAGVVTVISAGNDGATSQVTFPSCISTAVSVGATTKDDIIWDYSNMASMVDPLAPGAEIHSSLPTSTYKPMSGTSMAAPHVAGAFTAIRSYCTGKTIDQIETALKSTGMPITDNREGGTETKPRIRVDQALAQLACSGVASIRCTQEAKMCPSGAVVWRTGSACEFAPCPP
jgi:subtilisin family serine protease